ncbi:DUF599 domain-containing protein [Ramlibacter sp. WS9]|uniref:DUF599 domain-containing protein n=1 Tax=Ramlibacter sp. WS9 TaxID=1882741 RepID=UPI001144E664|nr:DUF599 domain-containing protein [Ramlibacter sp. WS9]ROZ75427.1 DUF599 domain-containing protein [Ramlibacter sp. WS9]
MSPDERWIAAALTIAVLALYEIWFALAQRRNPGLLARSAHASLREDWFAAVSQQPGSEVLAVQTLRNSLMSASMTASTAVLGLMGTITLSASSLDTSLDGGVAFEFTPRLALELILLALLFASLVTSVMAVRYYNHAGFVGAMPVGSEARRRWSAIGGSHLRRAGILYSWSLRNLVLVVPAVGFILHPAAGPVAAVLVVVVLYGFDRIKAGA